MVVRGVAMVFNARYLAWWETVGRGVSRTRIDRAARRLGRSSLSRPRRSGLPRLVVGRTWGDLVNDQSRRDGADGDRAPTSADSWVPDLPQSGRMRSYHAAVDAGRRDDRRLETCSSSARLAVGAAQKTRPSANSSACVGRRHVWPALASVRTACYDERSVPEAVLIGFVARR